jgi:hypothetical protein
VLPFAVGSIGFIWYLRSGRSAVQLNFRSVTPRWELFADILKVGSNPACPSPKPAAMIPWHAPRLPLQAEDIVCLVTVKPQSHQPGGL